MKKNFFLSVFVIPLFIACNNNSKLSSEAVSVNQNTNHLESISEEKDTMNSDVAEIMESVLEENHEELIIEENPLIIDVFDPDYINGRWEAEDQNGYSFGAWFDSEKGKVIGQYCAMNHDASRIDCGTHEEIKSCYLKSGQVKGKEILEIEVVSCYALKKGKATLSVQDDGNLVWRLVESPGVFEVDHFAPEVALLRKVSFDPFE